MLLKSDIGSEECVGLFMRWERSLRITEILTYTAHVGDVQLRVVGSRFSRG